MQSLGLATDGTNVYAASLLHGSVVKVPVNGGKAITLASGLQWPNCLALDANYVYIADEGANAIVKIAK